MKTKNMRLELSEKLHKGLKRKAKKQDTESKRAMAEYYILRGLIEDGLIRASDKELRLYGIED